MRIKVLIMPLLLLLASFAIKAYSVDWNYPEDKSVDDLISSGNNYPSIPSLSEQALASRSDQVGQQGKDILSVPFGSNPATPASNPRTISQEPIAASKVNVQANPTVSSGLAAVSGSWSLELNDSVSHKAVLIIFQNGDAVYGTGTIYLDANTVVAASAGGIVAGDQVNLDIISSGKVSFYRAVMKVGIDSATGSYTVYSPGLSPLTGTVKGLRFGS